MFCLIYRYKKYIIICVSLYENANEVHITTTAELRTRPASAALLMGETGHFHLGRTFVNTIAENAEPPIINSELSTAREAF